MMTKAWRRSLSLDFQHIHSINIFILTLVTRCQRLWWAEFIKPAVIATLSLTDKNLLLNLIYIYISNLEPINSHVYV